MKRLTLLLIAQCLGLAANASGNASIRCDGPAAKPVMQVTYSPDGDAGAPGLFWLALVSPDETLAFVLSQRGWLRFDNLQPWGWTATQSDQSVHWGRYDQGLPPAIGLVAPFPDTVSSSTGAYAGYSLYLAHGVLSTADQERVRVRREVLNAAKPALMERGRWRPENDDDLGYSHSLVQRDMRVNRKFGVATIVPDIDCQRGGR